LDALQDKLGAEIAELAQTIATLSSEISTLNDEHAKRQKLRSEEHQENMETIQDAKEAQIAVKKATQILKDFYRKGADATALNQQPENKPEIFDEKYTGMQSEHGGVQGMMEVILSDFVRLQSDTETAENEAQHEFNAFSTKNKSSVAQKEEEKKDANKEKKKREGALVTCKSDLKDSKEAYEAAMGVFEKLKPPCVSTGVNYDDRVAQRKEEIQSLEEALDILS